MEKFISSGMTIQIFSAILQLMTIEQACIEDLDFIMNIYRLCTDMLQKQGLHQWSERYPTRDIVAEDIRQGRAHILRSDSGEITGTAAVDPSPPDEAHKDIIWEGDTEQSAVISRLAVVPHQQGNGIGGALFSYAERLAVSQGAVSLRLDVDSRNVRLLKMYKDRGYSLRGSVWYDDPPKEFFAMEKQVPKIDIHWASDNELPQIFAIRDQVFIEGQQVARELEQDGLDDEAKHVILYEEGKPAGCARIRWMSLELEGTESRTLLYWKVERLAVVEHARSKGYGKLIMEWIIRKGSDQEIDGLTLHAQKYLEDFYQSLGFKTEGKPFMEAGIKHISMSKSLAKQKDRHS